MDTWAQDRIRALGGGLPDYLNPGVLVSVAPAPGIYRDRSTNTKHLLHH